jgi:Xaa-Pro aminopeptidase
MSTERLERVRQSMTDQGVDVLLLSVGPDLPWLIGYQAMPLERLTMLVVPRDDEPVLVIPRLEAPRVDQRPDQFRLDPWNEGDDPLDRVAEQIGRAGVAAIDDRTWARFVLGLQSRRPDLSLRPASTVTGPLRAVKDDAEIAALTRAGAAADVVAEALHAGEIALVGRTEAEVSAEIGRRLLAEGHQRVNFAIVGAGENAASPHHDAGDRVIRANEVVLCDFGGTMLSADGAGYCSDTTRCVYTGPPPDEFVELYGVLQEAQAVAVRAAAVGRTAAQVDAAARDLIASGGYGDAFIHRTGHGIGIEEHEDPYIVAGNDQPLVAGNAFSVEPGIYLAGRWGARIEDIVVATDAGPVALNQTDHSLVVVEA